MKKTHFYKMEKSCKKLNLPYQLLRQARWSWRRRLCCVLRWCQIPVLIHRSPGQSPPPGPTRCSTGTEQQLSVKSDQIKRIWFYWRDIFDWRKSTLQHKWWTSLVACFFEKLVSGPWVQRAIFYFTYNELIWKTT